jgi:hypothetical protein
MAPAKVRAHVVHHVPGRVRLRVPSRRGDRHFFDAVGSKLGALDGVSAVRTNAATGSVLIRHDGPLHALLAQALGSPLAELVELDLNAPAIAERVRAMSVDADRTIRRFTNGEFDLTTAAAFALVGAAAVQLLRGRPPSGAVTLAWYASELLTRWRPGPAVHDA